MAPSKDDQLDELRSAAFAAGRVFSTAELESALNAPVGNVDLALATLGLPPRGTAPRTSSPVASASSVPVASAGYPTIKVAHAVVITEAPPAYAAPGSKSKQEPRTFASHHDKIDVIRDHGYAAGKALSTADIERALQASNGDVHAALQAQGLPPLPMVTVTIAEPPRAVQEKLMRAPLLAPGAAASDSPVHSAGGAVPARPPMARSGSYQIKRQNSHHWTPPEQFYRGSHEASLRNGFLRKVYGIVFAQVLLTAGVCYYMLSDGVATVAAARAAAAADAAVLADDQCSDNCQFAMDGACDDGGEGFVTSACEFGADCGDCGIRPAGTPLPLPSAASIATAPLLPLLYPVAFATLFLVCCLHGLKNRYPHNYLLLFTFTLLESYVVGFCCVAYGVDSPEVVYEAFALTAALFFGLTAFTMQSRINFDFLGAGLVSSLFLLIVWGWMTIAFGLPFPNAAYSLVGALIFCLFIIYDTHMICHRLGYDDYIVAAIELYLDLINLFLKILSLLGRRN